MKTKRAQGRPKLDESLHRSHRIYAGLTKEEYQSVAQVALAEDKTLSEYAKDALMIVTDIRKNQDNY